MLDQAGQEIQENGRSLQVLDLSQFSNPFSIPDFQSLSVTRSGVLPLDGLGTVVSLGIGAVIVSFWVTVIYYWLFRSQFSQTRRKGNAEGYRPHIGNRISNYNTKDYLAYSGSWDSPDYHTRDSFHSILKGIQKQPTLERTGSTSLESVGGLLTGTLVQGTGVDSQTNGRVETGEEAEDGGGLLSGVGSLITGGVESVTSAVTNKNVTDCVLQLACYMSSPGNQESRSFDILSLWKDETDFEGRKKKDSKEKERRRKEKQEKKDRKEKKREQKRKEEEERKKLEEEKRKEGSKKQKNDENEDDDDDYYDDEYYDDEYYDEYYDDEYDEDDVTSDKKNKDDDDLAKKEEEASTETEEDGDLAEEDCEVFSCPAARVGYVVINVLSRLSKYQQQTIVKE